VSPETMEPGVRSMRAVRVDELGDIEHGGIALVEYPVPGPNELVVEVRAAPVNFVDLLTMEGKYQFRPSLPYTPGKGPAGVVAMVGRDVDDFATGDRVLAMAEYGGWAEAVVVDSRQVYLLPDGLDFPDAAAMSLAFDTAWMALTDRARLEPGDSVLVLGATGAVGEAAIQLARAMGASLVLAGLSSPTRLDASPLAASIDGAVDLGRPDLRESIRTEVFSLTDGAGVDVIVDVVGGQAFEGAVRSLAWRGRYVIVGFASGTIPTLKMNYPLLKNIEISGLQISDYRRRMPELVARGFRDIFDFVESGQIRVPQYTTRPLEDWRSALESIKERRTDGRLILEPLQAAAEQSR
jgi:NADPH2:quinone reductase